MILAAGLGTRLRPFTKTVPKPLLPVANRPLLEYTLALLAGAGITEVIINTHHLAEEMEEGLRRAETSGVKVHLSRERRILGTGGGPKKAAPFLEGDTFLVLNGDFLIDIDLRDVISFHRESASKATMVLREDDGGGIFIDGEGRIRQFLEPGRAPDRSWTRTGFTGIHVLEPEVLKLIPRNTPWEINLQVYPEILRRGWRTGGFLHSGYWREAGDPEGYLAANLEILFAGAGSLTRRPDSGTLDPPRQGLSPPVLLGEGVFLEPGSRLGPGAVIGPGARIGRGAQVRRSVILEGTDIPDGEVVVEEIRSPEATVGVPAGAEEAGGLSGPENMIDSRPEA